MVIPVKMVWYTYLAHPVDKADGMAMSLDNGTCQYTLVGQTSFTRHCLGSFVTKVYIFTSTGKKALYQRLPCIWHGLKTYPDPYNLAIL